MEHPDHVNLIQKAVPTGGIWADLGSGRGAFTLALADCLGGGTSHIYSIDTDQRALKMQETRMHAEYPHQPVSYIEADFTQPLDLPPLDGILMANSLHFVRDKQAVVEQIRHYLKPDGRLVLVEYNTNQGNYAVPYPMTFDVWKALSEQWGFRQTDLIATRPSRFLGAFFASVSYR